MNRSIFLTAHKEQTITATTLNFGPQHPAAHGVLRLILTLDAEYIVDSDVHIGLLHRGSEKLMENKPYLQSLPYFDRFDYVSMMVQEHAFCLVLEKMLKKTFLKRRSNIFRTIFDEITRILNHLLALACHALDVGSMSPIFWGFEEREKLLEFYERVSGARMHAAFYRPGLGTRNNISHFLYEDILLFISNHFTAINEIHFLLVNNKIWKMRLIQVGQFNYTFAKHYGLTGVLLRSTGVSHDLRLSPLEAYASYPTLQFNSYIAINGDCYDRYLLRISEILESLNILNKLVVRELQQNFKQIDLLFQSKDTTYKTMEGLINHFKYWSEGDIIGAQTLTAGVESPKGEFSVFIAANNSSKPSRVKVRSSAYFSLQALKKLSTGHLLADLITLIGTIDIVFGEIDR